MARVKKIDAPIFVIGLGGTGFDVLMRVKSDFSKRFETAKLADGSYSDCPPRTEYLAIDSDPSTGRTYKYGMRLAPTEFCNIEGDVAAAHALLKNKTYVSEWVDNSIASMGISHDGAGQVRQVGRLFLFNSFDNVRARIEGKLAVLANVPAGAADRGRKIEIKIMSGVCGGTGSGTLLDIAYIIKDIAREHNYSINMEAFLFMPDTTVAFAAKGSGPLIKSLHTNSYALLKELDYWMAADANGIQFTQQYTDVKSIKWEGAPFNDVYLQCATNENKVGIEDAYHHNIEVISEYLVHCYEGDPNGLEKIEILKAKDGGATNAANSFSFQSARSNQDAIINGMFQPYPVPYRYHSLGAFSNAGEDRLMELTEWDMIYTETVRRFDENIVQMDGAAPEDFQKAVMTFEQASNTPAGTVRKDYDKRHPIPDVAEDYKSKELFNQTQAAAPHGDLYTSISKGLDQSFGDEKIKLSAAVWEVFIKEARLIGEDVKRGPQYLLDLLTKGENSLQQKLPTYIASIDTKCRTAGEEKDNKFKQCQGAFDTFVQHNFLGIRINKKALYETYMADARDLYSAVRNHAYYKALGFALEDFSGKLHLFVALLTDLVTAIRGHQQETQQELTRAKVVDTLFDVSKMKANLTQLFAEEAARDTAIRELYKGTLDITESCMGNGIPKERLPQKVDQAIDSLRENMFVSVGGMSITQKITTYMHVLPGDAMVAHVNEVLAPKFDTGAAVMYSPSVGTGALTPEKAARTSVVSVPEGEDDIADGIKAFCERNNMTVILKRTPKSDRIFWVNDKGGMPMYFYSWLDTLRADYASQIGTQKGFHLFMADTHSMIHDPIKQNWLNVMPDPVIYRQAREIGEKAELLKKAEELGTLQFKYNFPQNGVNQPDVSIELHKLQKIKGVEASDYLVTEAIGALPEIEAEMKLTMAKDVPAIDAKLAELQAHRQTVIALLDNPQISPISIEHLANKAKEWGNTLGNYAELVPLDGSKLNDQQLKAKEDEWKKAFERAIREALSLRPLLLEVLKEQNVCRTKISDALAALDERIAALSERKSEIVGGFDVQKVIAFAPKLARLMMYDRIRLLPTKANAYPAEMDEPKDIFTMSTETPGLASAFEKYREFPMAVRLASYLSHEGAKSVILEDTIQIAAKVARKVENAEDVTKDVTKCFKSAKKIFAMLKKNAKAVQTALYDDELSRADADFCTNVLSAMTAELKQFIDAWDPYMPDDEEE